MNNYTRTPATEIRQGDTIVLFNELTGDQRTVTLGQRKTYPGDGRYWEFYLDGNDRIGLTKGDEVMRAHQLDTVPCALTDAEDLRSVCGWMETSPEPGPLIAEPLPEVFLRHLSAKLAAPEAIRPAYHVDENAVHVDEDHRSQRQRETHTAQPENCSGSRFTSRRTCESSTCAPKSTQRPGQKRS